MAVRDRVIPPLARLADARQDLLGDPVLERAGGGGVRAHDQLVERALREEAELVVCPLEERFEGRFLAAPLRDDLLLVVAEAQVADMVGLKSEGAASVRSDEPGLPVDGRGADRVGDALGGYFNSGGAAPQRRSYRLLPTLMSKAPLTVLRMPVSDAQRPLLKSRLSPETSAAAK